MTQNKFNQIKELGNKIYSIEGIELIETGCSKCKSTTFEISGIAGDNCILFLKCVGCGWGYRCNDFTLANELPLGALIDSLFIPRETSIKLEVPKDTIETKVRTQLQILYAQYSVCKPDPELNVRIDLLERLLQ